MFASTGMTLEPVVSSAMASIWSPAMPAFGEDLAHGLDERVHLVGVGLRGVVGVFAAAVQGIAGGGCAEAAALGVEQSDAHAEGSEVDAGDNTHSNTS